MTCDSCAAVCGRWQLPLPPRLAPALAWSMSVLRQILRICLEKKTMLEDGSRLSPQDANKPALPLALPRFTFHLPAPHTIYVRARARDAEALRSPHDSSTLLPRKPAENALRLGISY